MSVTKNMSLLSIVLILILLVVAVAGFLSFQKYQTEQRLIAEQQKAEQIRKEAVAEYEDVLSSFVQDIAKEVKAYKTQRMVLRELTRPHNFSTPDYAKQNYEEFKNQILPALEKQSQRVLTVFDLAGAKIDQILESKPEDTRLFIRTKWQAMRDVEYRNYSTFFEADKTVLKAYEELLRFYFVKVKSYKTTEDGFVFDNPQDKQAEQDLLKIIKDLQVPEKQEEPQSLSAPAESKSP